MSAIAATAGSFDDARLRRWAFVTFWCTSVLFAIGAAFVVVDAAAGDGAAVGPLAFDAITFSFAVTGVLIARHQPRNSIPWILLGLGLTWGVGNALEGYTNTALITSPGSLPGGVYTDVLGTWLWVPGIVPMGTFLLLLFPDGHLQSPRWRWLMWLTTFTMAAAAVAIVFKGGSLADDGFPQLSNPFGVPAMQPLVDVFMVSLLLIPVCVVASAVGLVLRFRRSRGIDRLQLKWLATAAAVVAATYGVAMVVSIPYSWLEDATPPAVAAVQMLALASFALIPLSIGVAILRYRLYDIDRLISRAVSYAIVTAVLAAVYAAVVVGLGTAFGRTGNPVLIAGATLLVAGLFGPLRRRVQGAVDRRFNRRAYDAERVLGAFSTRLRDELDIDALTGELRSAVASAVQPLSVGVWIRRGGGGP